MRRSLLCSALLVVAPISGAGEAPPLLPDPAAAGFSPGKLARVDAIAQALVDEKKLAGCVIAISRHGRLAYLKAFGCRELEGRKPMEIDSIFRIFSMTKAVTSAAAMILVEEGKLDLDEKVSAYLPVFRGLQVHDEASGPRPPRREMTVRDLLGHTAGLTYGLFGDTPVDRAYREKGVLDGSLEEMARKLAEIPLLHDPGEGWTYSVATDVLGLLIEKQSGQGLDAFFEERIFRPLGMKDSGFQVAPAEVGRFTASYDSDGSGGLALHDDPRTSGFLRPPAMFSGGGGLVSTAPDFLRFCQMIANGGELGGKRLLRESSVDLMRTNQLPESLLPIAVGEERPGTGFGLGFSVRLEESEADPGSQVGEYGWGGAASTHYWISPRDGVVVVTMEQTRPYAPLLEHAIKKPVYDAVER